MKRLLLFLAIILLSIWLFTLEPTSIALFIFIIYPICIVSLFIDSLPQLFIKVLQGKIPLKVFTCIHDFIQFEDFNVESRSEYYKLVICKKCSYITASDHLDGEIDIPFGDRILTDGRLFVRNKDKYGEYKSYYIYNYDDDVK
jgi:hypothetical protein